MEKRLAEIETSVAREGFWNKPDEAKVILKERTALSHRLDRFKRLEVEIEDHQELYDLAVAEADEETLKDLASQAAELQRRVDRFAL